MPRPRTKLSSLKRRVDHLHRLVNGIIPFGKVKSDRTFTKHSLVINICNELRECATDLKNNEQDSVAFALRDNLANMKAKSKSNGSRNRMSDALKLQYGLGQLDNDKEAKLMAFAKKLGIDDNNSASDDTKLNSNSNISSNSSSSESSSSSNVSSNNSDSRNNQSQKMNEGKIKQEHL